MIYNTGLQPCCSSYAGCASCTAGMCTALCETKFEDGKCPFYKTREEAQMGKLNALASLLLKGRVDLLEKYYGDGCLPWSGVR